MKKTFHKLAVLFTASNLALPSTACSFNFYVNSATRSKINAFANETSSIIKSLILAKEKKADNSQTIQDILQNFSNSSINNNSNNNDLKTWKDFSETWGFKQKINLENSFKPEDYFIATGDGALTKTINIYRNINSFLSASSYLSTLNVADNRILYDLFNKSDIKSTITNFLNQLTKKPEEIPPNLKEIIILLKNTLFGLDEENPDEKYFSKTIIQYLTSFFDYLTDNKWSSDQTTPINTDQLKEFMSKWKDADEKPYSQWTSSSTWNLADKYYKNWTKESFEFYRSGVLINYLFYKIGKDNKIQKPGTDKYEDRYLGDIIASHIKLTPWPPHVDFKTLLDDLKQYLPALLKNPSYFILITEAIIPIIKQWGLKVSDINKGVKHLTFGKKYPTDDQNNSYNMLDILNNINELLNNPEKLKYILINFLDLDLNDALGDPRPENAFAYDIRIKFIIVDDPLPKRLTLKEIEGTIDQAIKFLTSEKVKGAIENILNIYQKLIIQYDDSNEGIQLDLVKLKDFFLNETNGLITAINRDIIPFLYQIIKNKEPIDEEKYWEFYNSLGGQAPKSPGEIVKEFRSNSVLDILKTNSSDINLPLGQLFYLLFGNNAENKKGLFTFIIESNNQWIDDNYTKFFDINNQSTGQISNATMQTIKENNIISDILIYNFNYQINNHTYSFLIKCKSWNEENDFTGLKNFYFTDIILLK